MKSLIKILVVLVVVQMMSGCFATKSEWPKELVLTVHSDPPGATIYTATGRIGKAPVELYYYVTEEAAQKGIVKLNWITARWVSGVSVTNDDLYSNLSSLGYSHQHTFLRPAGAPNVELDVAYSLGLENLSLREKEQTIRREEIALLERQIKTLEKQAEYEKQQNMWNNYNNTMNLINQIKQQQMMKRR